MIAYTKCLTAIILLSNGDDLIFSSGSSWIWSTGSKSPSWSQTCATSFIVTLLNTSKSSSAMLSTRRTRRRTTDGYCKKIYMRNIELVIRGQKCLYLSVCYLTVTKYILQKFCERNIVDWFSNFGLFFLHNVSSFRIVYRKHKKKHTEVFILMHFIYLCI